MKAIKPAGLLTAENRGRAALRGLFLQAETDAGRACHFRFARGSLLPRLFDAGERVMLRTSALAIVAILLAGCEPPQPSPAMAQLQNACQSGDMRACEVVVSEERARREALAKLLIGDGSVDVPVYRPPRRTIVEPAMPAMRGPTTTNCRPDYMGGMSCTTY